MESYGKKIYIWELAVKSHGVPDPTPKWYPTWVPPVDEYTEEYQERVFMEVFKMFIDDPQIVGVALLDYCDDPPELNRESVHFLTSMQAGLLRSDKTQKPLYSTLKDYWYSLFTDYSGTSDENGQVVFNAIPGLFDIYIGGEVVTVHLHADDVIYASETGKPVALSSNAETSSEPLPDDIPTEGTPDAGEAISPCDLSEDLMGQEIEVYGTIGFVDIGGEGTFFELKENGCWTGVFVSSEDWSQWPPDIKAEISQNSEISIKGLLGKFGEEWEIQMLEPPYFED